MPAANKSELLATLIQQRLDGFKLDDKEAHVDCPTPSLLPFSDFTSHFTRYTKRTKTLGVDHTAVKFIQKDGEPDGFIWETDSEKLRLGVRWGIVDTESVTGKVISALGQYRITAQERIAKGIISNTHRAKIALLDHYQDRCEALQDLESMVNKENSKEDFKKTIDAYISKLKNIQNNIDIDFKDSQIAQLEPHALERMKADITADIQHAEDYLAKIKASETTKEFSQAYGTSSCLEFAKSQMVRHLYEFQGINQDLSFSTERPFAATRGEINNCIEDARKIIDDHRPDLHNPVEDAHHGIYKKDKTYIYDYSDKHLSPERERQILLALSSIEGYDEVVYDKDGKPFIINHLVSNNNSRELKVIHATNYITTRTLKDFFLRIAYGLLNMLISFALPTRPWSGNPWGDCFELAGITLQRNAKENNPIWHKPVQLIKQIFYSLFDGVKSIESIARKLVIELPKDLQYDMECTKAIPDLGSVIEAVHAEIKKIEHEENTERENLIAALNKTAEEKNIINFQPITSEVKPSDKKFARPTHHLGPGEQNDILCALARGLNDAGSVFSHDMFAKNPVAGLAFLTLYVGGLLIIAAPNTMAFLGESILSSQKAIALAMGESIPVQAISLAVTDASIGLLAVDTLEHGFKSIAAEAAEELVNELPTVAVYFAVAQGIGFLLTVIPGIGPVILSELGEMPLINRFFVGAKVGVVIFEISQKEKENPVIKIHKTTPNGLEEATYEELSDEDKIKYNQFQLITLLSKYDAIAKLDSITKHNIERQIDYWFIEKPLAAGLKAQYKEAESLKKVIYPEVARSIAYYLITIPLSYIPAILHVLISPILSIAACIMGRENPLAPMKNASLDLLKKSARDLTRLIVFVQEITYVVYMGVASILRLLVNNANLLIGRVASWFGGATGHDSHKVFAAIHNFFRMIGAFCMNLLGPILSNVGSAHPTPAIEKIAARCSSSDIFGKLGGEPVNNPVFEKDESKAIPPAPTEDSVSISQEPKSGFSLKS